MTSSKLLKPSKSCASFAKRGQNQGLILWGHGGKETVGREYLGQFQEFGHMVAVPELPQGRTIFLQTWNLRTFSAISVLELICGKYVEKIHLSKVNEGLSECPTPLWLLCYNYLNVSANRWKKIGRTRFRNCSWETHRMYEKEVGIPKLPLWSMAYNRCWFIWSLYFLLWEEWTCCKKQLLDMHILM